MVQRHKDDGFGIGLIVLRWSIASSGEFAILICVFGDGIEASSWYVSKPRLSAVQLRGPRPQYFEVVKEKSQNWYSHVDITLRDKSATSEVHACGNYYLLSALFID